MCSCNSSCSNRDSEKGSFIDILLVCKICELPSLKDKPKTPNPWPVYIYRVCVDCESKTENGNAEKAKEPVNERKECEGCEMKFYGIGSVSITAERHRTRHWEVFCEDCATWVVDVWRETSGPSDIFYDCQTISSNDVGETTSTSKRISSVRNSI